MALIGKQRTHLSYHVVRKRKITVLGVVIASIVVTLIITMLYLTVHPPPLVDSPSIAAGSSRGNPDSNMDVNALIPKLLPLQDAPKGFATEIHELLTSPVLPQWVKDYVRWHATERQKLLTDPSLWKSFRFLMLQCLPGSRKCGGTADRLKPLPVMLRIAHQNKRLLLIKWGRPAELEEYLLPPQGGLDWRVPESLYQIQEFRQGPRATYVEELIDFCNHPDHVMVKARVQAHDHGSVWYNEQRRQQALVQQLETAMEPTFEAVYHLVWPILFTPAPPVAKLIERQIDESEGLVPGRYVGIHIRALYAVSERDPGMVQHWTRNAVNCASQILPGGPFYLSSDSSFAVTVGTTYGREHQVVVGSRTSTTTKVDKEHSHAQPFHLDKAPRSAKVSDFYDTFVDLYIMAMSLCVTYNMGGFGTWALLMSPFANKIDSKNNNQHSVCSFQHHEASGIHKCEWARADNKPSSAGKQQQQVQKPFFLPPMA